MCEGRLREQAPFIYLVVQRWLTIINHKELQIIENCCIFAVNSLKFRDIGIFLE